ncbi:MAG: aspartate kinase [Clostridiales bacterium]|nr:aspartate kinase [Clostridiales bacterium]MCD8110073.1 aspartate kinase [Clostridiales bacterium]MCD8133473.1 aspartate kinase [Clostridiales bacterium]
MRKVVKFGGSSLASAEQFQKVGDIIRADADRRFVIPSAPGKRFDGDTKVTDLLYDCYAAAEAGENFEKKLDAIHDRYRDIISGLGLDFSLNEDFQVIREKFQEKAGRDYAASRGEYLNGKVLANYLGYEFIDSATVIFFDEDGTFAADETNKLMAKRLEVCENAVIPGFYGAYADGRVKTFSRGGSDITGSIVARALQADLYENWTDVSGFLVTDPHVVENPEVVEMITYRELRELAYMGASVLHEEAIFPVRKAGIPINIKNTNHPDDPGTMIVATTSRKPRFTITGIAGKKGFVAVTVDKDMMNSEIGFCRKVLSVFEENQISIEHMPSGIDTMCILVHQDEFQEHEQVVLSGIQRAVNPDSISVEPDLALIAVVGRGMRQMRGTAGRIFSALAHAKINCRMIDQGSSELNIIIGVSNEDFDRAIQSIYDIFILTQL